MVIAKNSSEILSRYILFDVDVVGGCNIKKYYGQKALAIFVQPPSVEELEKRLIARSTDSAEVIAKRVAKAAKELEYASQFDVIIVNNQLEAALNEAEQKVTEFIRQ